MNMVKNNARNLQPAGVISEIDVQNVQNSQHNEAPQVFQNTPTTDQQLMVGQEERVLLQTMNQLMKQMMRKMNLQ